MANSIQNQIIVGVVVGVILMVGSAWWRKQQEVAPPVADNGNSWYSWG